MTEGVQSPMRCLGLLFLAAVWLTNAGPGSAQKSPWFLDSCTSENVRRAAELRVEILKSKRGSSMYVPHPYPLSEREVLEDLRYQLRGAWGRGSRGEIPAEARPVLDALESDEARFEVIAVTEWRPARCGPVYGETDFLYLVLVYSSRTSEELARVALAETGLLWTFIIVEPGEPGGIRDFERIDSLVQRHPEAAGATDRQYVAVAGRSLSCGELRPCIAFRKAGRPFLLQNGKLFALELDRPGVAGASTRDLAMRTERGAAAASARRPGEHLVTVGADGLAVATPVSAEDVPQ